VKKVKGLGKKSVSRLLKIEGETWLAFDDYYYFSIHNSQQSFMLILTN